MFDIDLDGLSTADLLAAGAEYVQDQEDAAVGVLRVTLAFADRNAVVDWAGRELLPGYERLRVYGGEGCPGVGEFAPVELGAVLGMSSGAAASLLGEALALRHRLPRVWAAVLSGNAIAWRARKIAHACLSLSIEAAAIVDARVAGIVNNLTPGRLKKIVTAAMWEADPAQAQAAAEAAAKTRGVFVAQSDPDDDYGTKRIFIRAPTGAVVRFKATVDDLAQALQAFGDTDTLDERRAKAIDWLSDPAAADHLLKVYHHLTHTQAQPAQTDTNQPTPEHQDAATTADTTAADAAAAEAPEPDVPGAPGPDDVVVDENPAAAGHHQPNQQHEQHEQDDRDEQHEWDQRDEWQDPAADTTNLATGRDRQAVLNSEPGTDSTDGAGYAGGRCADDGEYDTSDTDTQYDTPDSADTDGMNHVGYLLGVDDPDHPHYPVDAAGPSSAGRTVHHGDADGASTAQELTRPELGDTLQARLAAIKQQAHTGGPGTGGTGARSAGGRGRRHTLYVHLTDKTLAAGTGVLRVEGLGPLLASQLGELLGHDRVVVKPVIDLHDQVSVDSYEIPDGIRERVRLRHPVDMFPYGGRETTTSMDLDHITPYKHAHTPEHTSTTGDAGRAECVVRADTPAPGSGTGLSRNARPPGRAGLPAPPGQTNVDNLIPQGRLHHRAKTFGGWRNRRLPEGAIEWISPHGFVFRVDHTGTHRVTVS
ncbi:hypothetical protein ACQHIV_12830 [Kribbella sp. GL6]|uniref:hypothetical protein n=1 Tax=Kribbella sp. GL6 TaxID=3419765 RepID=UPI003CFD68FF